MPEPRQGADTPFGTYHPDPAIDADADEAARTLADQLAAAEHERDIYLSALDRIASLGVYSEHSAQAAITAALSALHTAALDDQSSQQHEQEGGEQGGV